jgi:signal transduction histidine kinase
MNELPIAPAIATHAREYPAPARLRGRALVIARLLWVAIAGLTLGLFIVSVPLNFAYLQTVCEGATCRNGSRATAAGVAALADSGLTLRFLATYIIGFDILVVVTFSAIALMIFWRKSDDRMGLFGSLTLLVFGTATFPDSLEILMSHYLAWQLPIRALEFYGQVGLVSFLFVFPDGRFVPHWTRWMLLGWAAYQFSATFFRGSVLDIDRISAVLSNLVWLFFLGSVIASQIYRYQTVSTPLQREQTKWVVFGMMVGISGFLAIITVVARLVPATWDITGTIPNLIAFTLIYMFILLLPLSIGIAILRARLWDIDVLINRTLVYGTLTASVAGLYILIVGYLGTLFQTNGNVLISLLATGLVAVLFQPLRERLQRAANRLLYGERDDPYTVISRLGQRLEATLAPEAVLPTITETVAQALRLPYVAIALTTDNRQLTTDDQHFGIIAAHGIAPVSLSACQLVSLSYQGEPVGQLILSPRAPGESFSSADQRLLADLARQAGIAAHAVLLTRDLQRSRERLVTAREEERRRLRRDLHDGLGPQLAGVTLKLDAARNLLNHDPAAANTLLAELKTQTQTAIADIRRLVYDLRPPALDDVGLISALREQISQYEYQQLNIIIDAPSDLPPLPAAIEVAAYRIAQEAITNVVRHANARTCIVSLGISNGLCLDIRDDGCGLPDQRRSGVGLSSMREREILTLIAQGHNNTDIADRLVLSPKTVRNNVSNIFSKLQVADRAQAIVRARAAGLAQDRR